MSFFKYYPTRIDGLSLQPFTLKYLLVLAVTILLVVVIIKRGVGRTFIQHEKAMGILVYSLLVLELLNQVWLFLATDYDVSIHLPFHLCGLIVFLIPLWWMTKRPEFLMNFIFYGGITGATLALIFNFHHAPVLNMQTFQTFAIHAVILCVPLYAVIYMGFVPKRRYFIGVIALMLTLAVVMYGIDSLLDANYFFLMKATVSSPLEVFEQWVGYPGSIAVAGLALILTWYGMLVFMEKREVYKRRGFISDAYLDRYKKHIH